MDALQLACLSMRQQTILKNKCRLLPQYFINGNIEHIMTHKLANPVTIDVVSEIFKRQVRT